MVLDDVLSSRDALGFTAVKAIYLNEQFQQFCSIKMINRGITKRYMPTGALSQLSRGMSSESFECTTYLILQR